MWILVLSVGTDVDIHDYVLRILHPRETTYGYEYIVETSEAAQGTASILHQPHVPRAEDEPLSGRAGAPGHHADCAVSLFHSARWITSPPILKQLCGSLLVILDHGVSWRQKTARKRVTSLSGKAKKPFRRNRILVPLRYHFHIWQLHLTFFFSVPRTPGYASYIVIIYICVCVTLAQYFVPIDCFSPKEERT